VSCDKILNAARDHGAQAIGLSGLITPSLEEMSHVAAEMQRLGFADGAGIPLLIGGATTSRAHTAIKIAPHYSGPVIYVPDASRAVGVVTKLLSEGQSVSFAAEVAADYEHLRAQHAQKKGVAMVSLNQARANPFRWNADAAYLPPVPAQLGVHAIDVDLAELVDYIDWGPFFQTWDLAGSYPKILHDDIVGETARELKSDAEVMLARMIAEQDTNPWVKARAVYGLFPANSVGDDIEIYADESRSEVLMTWHGLRQQHERPAGKPNYCLADFIATKESGVPDYVGAFAVTAGLGIEARLAGYERTHDDYRAIMLKSLADRFAEATAEWLHARVRKEFWGYAAEETLSCEDLVKEAYRGIRPAPGYPACPDHTVKGDVFKLLDATANTGMELTESFAMTPAAAVSGFYFAHPDAHYFAVSKIGRDQLEDWARRTGMTVEDAARWLAPLL
jgi:5-methyltetrahydrofolate--homocysteine methyltransferase